MSRSTAKPDPRRGRESSARRRRAAWLAAICAAVAGCASIGGPAGPAGPAAPPVEPAPVPAPGPSAPAPSRPRSDASTASDALLRQSRDARAGGNYAEAASAIERALRLDANNAALWIELGELQLAQGNATQAASLARKALTLTGGDRALESRADRLLRAAGAG
jgi:tetratricopeptide (TPR) repeat protein